MSNSNWVIFRDHETSIRRRHYLNTPTATLHRSLFNEWNDLLDKEAYVRCLTVVTNQHEDAEADFIEAQRIDTRHMLSPHQIWRRAEIDVIDQALESRKAHLDALLGLLAEQKRLRADGVINASKRSQDWTRAELEASRGRLRRLVRMQDEAQRSQDAARRSAPAIQSGGGTVAVPAPAIHGSAGPMAAIAPAIQGGPGPVAVPAPAVHGGAGPVAGQDDEEGGGDQGAQEGNEKPEEHEGDGEKGGDGAEERNGAQEKKGAEEFDEGQEENRLQDGDGEQGGDGAQEGNEEQQVSGDDRKEPDQADDRLDELQTPVVQADAASESRRSSRQKNKRSRDRDENAADHIGSSPRKSPRHSPANKEPAILIEPKSSQEIPFAEPRDPIPGEDPKQTFESAWRNFLNGVVDEDREQWDILYERAKILADWNISILPDGSSDEALEQLQTEASDGLRQAIGWGWEEYMDKVRASENGVYDEHDLQQAQLAWDGALWRFDQGRSPMWPPPLKTAARHDPAPKAYPEHEVRPLTGSRTALEVAKDLGFGDITGLDGQWSYLTTVGGGNHGEAGLWLNVRYDEHRTLVEVSR